MVSPSHNNPHSDQPDGAAAARRPTYNPASFLTGGENRWGRRPAPKPASPANGLPAVATPPGEIQKEAGAEWKRQASSDEAPGPAAESLINHAATPATKDPAPPQRPSSGLREAALPPPAAGSIPSSNNGHKQPPNGLRALRPLASSQILGALRENGAPPPLPTSLRYTPRPEAPLPEPPIEDIAPEPLGLPFGPPINAPLVSPPAPSAYANGHDRNGHHANGQQNGYAPRPSQQPTPAQRSIVQRSIPPSVAPFPPSPQGFQNGAAFAVRHDAPRHAQPPQRPTRPPAIAGLPGNLQTLELDTVIKMGRAEYETGRATAAVALFQEALRRAPFRSDLRQCLGLAIEEQIRQGEANRSGNASARPSRVPGIDQHAGKEPNASLPDAYLPVPLRRHELVPVGVLTRLWSWSWKLGLVAVLIGVGVLAWPLAYEAALPLIDPRPESERIASSLLEKAEGARMAGDEETARIALGEALKQDPLPSELREHLAAALVSSWSKEAFTHESNGEWPKAIDAWTHAIEAQPDAAEPNGALAMAYYRAGTPNGKNADKSMLQKAKPAFAVALKLDPENGELLWSAADTLVKLGESPNAVPLWKKIVASTDPSAKAFRSKAEKALKSSTPAPKKK